MKCKFALFRLQKFVSKSSQSRPDSESPLKSQRAAASHSYSLFHIIGFCHFTLIKLLTFINVSLSFFLVSSAIAQTGSSSSSSKSRLQNKHNKVSNRFAKLRRLHANREYRTSMIMAETITIMSAHLASRMMNRWSFGHTSYRCG